MLLRSCCRSCRRATAPSRPHATRRTTSRTRRCAAPRGATRRDAGCDARRVSTPVAIEERQTGVSDGKTDVARRYEPCAASSASAGARPLSTARSNAAGVIPSTTIRTSFLAIIFRERAQPGVALGRAPAKPRGDRRERDGGEVADDRDPRERRQRQAPHPSTSAAVPPRVPPRRSAPRTICAAPSAPASPPSAPPTTSPQPPGCHASTAKPRPTPAAAATAIATAATRAPRSRRASTPAAGAEPGAHADPVPRRPSRPAYPGSTFVPLSLTCADGDTSRPCSSSSRRRRSGPARRMESLLAHIARKERDTLRVKTVDVDERPDLAKRFRVVRGSLARAREGQACRREARGPSDRAEDRVACSTRTCASPRGV